MERCFHPENYSITWVHQVQTQFSLRGGTAQSPLSTHNQTKPHVRFECGDCGFMAYYAAHNAPHWFPAKMEAVGTTFENQEQKDLSRIA